MGPILEVTDAGPSTDLEGLIALDVVIGTTPEPVPLGVFVYLAQEPLQPPPEQHGGNRPLGEPFYVVTQIVERMMAH